MTRIAVVLACALIACSRGAGGPAAPAASPDAAVAARHARETIEEIYASLRRGNAQGLLPLLADEVFVAGPRAEDVFLGRTDAVVALSDVLDANRKHRLRSRDLRVVASPSGQSAWASDQIELDGVAFSLVAVLAHADDLWYATAIHVGRPVPAGKQPELLAAGRLARPAPLPREVAEAARSAASLFQQAADRSKLLDQLADDDATVVVGSGPREVTRSAKAIRKRWKKTVRRRPVMTVADAVRAQASTDGALAWVCATVDLGAEGKDAVPHRSFAIYRQAAARWELVALHDAVVAATK